MNLVRENVSPSFIENATVSKIYIDGIHKQYEVVPDEGFKLHDMRLDSEVFDEETSEPTGKMKKGFTRKGVTVRCDYDFEENSNQFYTVKEQGEENTYEQ